VLKADNDTATVIDTNTNTIEGNPISGYDHRIAYDPENKRMYVSDLDAANVSVINTATNTIVGNPITVGILLSGIAYLPIKLSTVEKFC
jgi:YVTN family beta-propeller protein